MNAMERIQRARTVLILQKQHCFFGMLALKLKLEENDNFQTAATDGEHMFFNERFIETLSDAQIKGLVAHEVMHNALGHTWRIGDRGHEL